MDAQGLSYLFAQVETQRGTVHRARTIQIRLYFLFTCISLFSLFGHM